MSLRLKATQCSTECNNSGEMFTALQASILQSFKGIGIVPWAVFCKRQAFHSQHSKHFLVCAVLSGFESNKRYIKKHKICSNIPLATASIDSIWPTTVHKATLLRVSEAMMVAELAIVCERMVLDFYWCFLNMTMVLVDIGKECTCDTSLPCQDHHGCQPECKHT